MVYDVANFIGVFASTSKTIKILLPNGKVSFIIFVCNYQKSSVKGKVLTIILEDKTKEYDLTFPTIEDANTAFINFKSAIDVLKVNCAGDINGTPILTVRNIFFTVPLSTESNVINVVISQITETSAVITWPPTLNAVGYNLEYNIYGNIFSNIFVKNIQSTSYVLENLERGKPYQIRVSAIIL